MVIDTSVLIAILFDEPDRRSLIATIEAAGERNLSAMSKLEAGMVAVGQRGKRMISELDDLLRDLKITVVPFDERQANIARDAFARYGKGRHKAALKFGDCAA
jgi:ribonuclease VapC